MTKLHAHKCGCHPNVNISSPQHFDFKTSDPDFPDSDPDFPDPDPDFPDPDPDFPDPDPDFPDHIRSQ